MCGNRRCTLFVKQGKATATFTEREIGDIDGGGSALVLCGYGPFGDCQSIRYRLDFARAQVKKITDNADELERCLPGDKIVKMWRREVEIWKYAIEQGEKLLARELESVANKT